MTASLEALIGDTVTDVDYTLPATIRIAFDSGRAIEVEGAPYMEPLEDFESDGNERRTNEHAATVAILEAIGELELTTDRQAFKTAPSTTAFYNQHHSEVLVSSAAIHQALESVGPNLAPQKIRALLEDLLAEGKATRPRTPDGDRFRAWRFEAHALADREVVSLETAFDAGGGE